MHIFLVAQSQDASAQKWPLPKVKWLQSLLSCNAIGLLLTFRSRQVPQIDDRHLDFEIRSHDLNRVPIYGLESRSHRFMAPDDFIHTPLQRGHVQGRKDSQSRMEIVERTFGHQLVKDPQAPLGI